MKRGVFVFISEITVRMDSLFSARVEISERIFHVIDCEDGLLRSEKQMPC